MVSGKYGAWWRPLWLWLLLGTWACQQAPEQEKILFLGNSITFGGRYVDYVETALLMEQGKLAPEIIDLGLSSETLSGLSEADHPFPRPDLHDRLSACLDSVRPGRVVACYGINDGIYHPFDSSRFQAYRQGIMRLIQACQERQIDLTLLTPPPYAAPLPDTLAPAPEQGFSYQSPYPYYDSVMAQYADYLRAMDPPSGVRVIDIRTPLSTYRHLAYGTDPIHPLDAGHAIMGETLLQAWGYQAFPALLETGEDASQADPAWRRLESQVRALRMAYDRPLLNHIGHAHPAVHQMVDHTWPAARAAYPELQATLFAVLDSLLAEN